MTLRHILKTFKFRENLICKKTGKFDITGIFFFGISIRFFLIPHQAIKNNKRQNMRGNISTLFQSHYQTNDTQNTATHFVLIMIFKLCFIL